MLRDPQILRVVAARFISHAGAVAGFFLGIWAKAAYELGADAFGLAAIMATLGLAGIVGSAVSGALVDRHGPKRVLIVSELVFVPSTLALIAASSVPEMIGLVLPSTLAGSATLTAVTSLPPFLTDDEERLQRINALIEGAGTAGFIAGPVLGAVIVDLAAVSWVFVADALSSLVAVALLVSLRLRPVTAAARDGRGSVRQILDGVVFTYRTPRLRLLLLTATAVYLSFGSFGALEPLFFRDVLGASASTIGYVNAVFGVGLLGGSILYARRSSRMTTYRWAVTLTALSGLGSVAYAGTDQLAVVVAGGVAWGLVLGAMMPLFRTLAQLAAPPHMVGRVMGAMQAHHQGGDLTPLLYAPALSSVFGPQAVLVGTGIVVSLAAAALSPAMRRLDDAPAAARPATDGAAARHAPEGEGAAARHAQEGEVSGARHAQDGAPAAAVIPAAEGSGGV